MVEHGDCLEVMERLADEGVQVESVVTDPPYHLTSIVKRFGKDGSAPAKSNGATGVYGRAAAGFMGQKWDGGDIAFRPETWQLVSALLKPGGHMLVFGGTRTFHRVACAIEDAGFEIRDAIMWHYGSGFPKSHNVSKGIDRARREDIEPVRAVCRFLRTAMESQSLKSRHLTKFFDDCHPRLIDHWAARDTDSQPELPTWAQWTQLKAALHLGDEMDAEVWRLNGRKGKPGDAWDKRNKLGEYDGDMGGLGGERLGVIGGDITSPATDAAKQWDGWGTALKPATEIICLARKPLSEKTVAANVLKHGTGAINIAATRVRPESQCARWPANVIHDGSEEVLEAFPNTVSHGGGQATYGGTFGSGANVTDLTAMERFRGDSGTAARFFYCAKADKGDRLQSKHPTVKPVDLIAYLCRLITPPGGTVLDPFAGSGTTAMACLREGFDAILIEKEARFVADIKRRLAHVEGADTPLFQGTPP